MSALSLDGRVASVTSDFPRGAILPWRRGCLSDPPSHRPSHPPPLTRLATCQQGFPSHRSTRTSCRSGSQQHTTQMPKQPHPAASLTGSGIGSSERSPRYVDLNVNLAVLTFLGVRGDAHGCERAEPQTRGGVRRWQGVLHGRPALGSEWAISATRRHRLRSPRDRLLTLHSASMT